MRRIVPVLLVLTLAVVGSWLLFSEGTGSTRVIGERGGIATSRLSQLPLYFVENQGQTDRQVGYYLQGRDTSVYFVSDGVVFALSEPRAADARDGAQIERVAFTRPKPRQRWAVKLEFVGANAKARPEGVSRTEAVVSYFKGPREKWAAGLATYAGVRYRELWPGIDLEYTGTQGRLKYTFTVGPGADASRIRLEYHGADGVELTPNGRIEIHTPAGGFAEDVPYVYQEVNGRRVAVDAAYELDSNTLAFRLGAYDRGLPLVLDPAVLVYAGYIGGAVLGAAQGIAVDDAGNVYVVGTTFSDETTFPVKVGPDVSFGGGYMDAFVAKVNAAGTALVYAGYIGGAGEDHGVSVAVDGAGNAYVAGYTDSDEATFPATVGPDITYNGGLRDAFVARVNTAGSALVYAGYIGGSGNDTANGIAVDAWGNAYVTGYTESSQATFPVKVGPDITYNGGMTDAFVAKVNTTGTGFDYAGYVGGSSYDYAAAIAVDAAGSAYLTGWTYSTETTFPVKGGPAVTFNGGGVDAFVAKVNAAGTTLDYAGYIGGGSTDYGKAIAVDGSGNAYVLGNTDTWATFPVKVGPGLTYNGGMFDAFVAKVNTTGSGLDYCGYIGGRYDEYAGGIAVDSFGNAYVAGETSSPETTFPTAGGFDATYAGENDAFVAEVNAAGSALVFSTYLGGARNDSASGIAVDSGGNVYVTGFTGSSEATFPVTIGPDTTYNGGTYNGFVAKIRSGTAAAAPSVTAIVSAASYGGGGVSPGEIVAIYGADLGPVTGVSNSGWDPSTGRLPTAISGTSVTFDGQSAPLFYVSAGQINAQVPYEVAGKASAKVIVTRNGSAGQAFNATVLAAHPGVFVYNDRAIISDNATGALITAANPIARGEYYANIWATGPGVVSPAATTGAPASASPLNWAANPQVWINGTPAEVAFAGLTPGMTGLVQVTVKIPATAPVGTNVSLKIAVNGVDAQAWIGGGLTSNLTVAIR